MWHLTKAPPLSVADAVRGPAALWKAKGEAEGNLLNSKVHI